MRRHDMVTGILLILSIINFTLAAPVSVQEKPQARVDVAHIPKDVMEKRWSKEIEMVVNDIFKTVGSGKPPASDPASETASAGSSCWGNCFASTINILKEMFSADYHPGHGGPMASMYGYQPYRKVPVTEEPDPNFDWEGWMNAEDPPSSSMPPRPSMSEAPPTIKEDGQASGYAPSPPLTDPHSPLPVAGPSESGDQSPEEIQATIYAAKGKAKETRRSSDTARDVGNAAQREFQLSSRSLDRGE